MPKTSHSAHWINLLVFFCLLGASCTPLQTSPGPGTPSLTSPATATPEPSATPAPIVSVGDFQSDGKLEDGWYWLKDARMANTAEWTLNNLPSEPGNINLKMKVLSTDGNGTKGLSASFILYFSTTGSGGQKQLLGQQTVTLLNTSTEGDTQAYTCTGRVTLDGSLLPAGVSSISITASRSLESYSDLPVGDRVAFASESIEIGPALLPFVPVNAAIYQGGDFTSDGDYINGWWWLRDADHHASATWNFSDIPAGTADIVINFEVLATDRPDGSGGFNASFYVSYGPVPEERQTDIPSELVNLTNAGLEVDPNGYTSRGIFTIPRANLPPGTDRIWMRISREDSQGLQPPIELHIAFMQTSVTFSEGSTDIGDSDSQEDAILITSGSYTGSLDAQDTEDWLTLYVGAKQVVSMEAQVPADAEFKATLYDPGMNQKEQAIPVETEALPHGITLAHIAADDAAGWWYLKFEQVSGEGEYHFTILPVDQQDAGQAGDAGDVPTAARSIENGTYAGIVMHDDPVDYYRIGLFPGENANVELTSAWFPDDTWFGSTGLKIELYRANGSPWKAAYTDQGRASLSANNSGDSFSAVFLAVRFTTGHGGPYHLDITFSGLSACRGLTAQANAFYTSGPASQGWYWLQDPGFLHTATWLFNVNPSGQADYRFKVSLPIKSPDGASGAPSGNFQAMYGPIPATETEQISGTMPVTLQTQVEPETITGYTGVGEFTIPRAALQSGTRGFWIRIYRINWALVGQPAVADLGVDQSAIQLCLGDQAGTVLTSPDPQPLAVVNLDPDSHILTSDTPIFVDPGSDPDGDGLNQNWEIAAANAINPITELDEGETWLYNRDSQHVVNFVRVYPYPSVPTLLAPRYIIFSYLQTWSMDYGKEVILPNSPPVYMARHRGDSERILMAWKVLDNNRIEFGWVYTSAHSNEATDHSGIWNANYSTCNYGNISNEYNNVIAREKMCSSLEYDPSSGRLVVYAARDKHGIYVNNDLCNNVILANIAGTHQGEFCGWDPGWDDDWSEGDFAGDHPRYQGSGRWLFTVYNVGEPDNYLINSMSPPAMSLSDTFPNESVWDGNATSTGDFCGGMTIALYIPPACSGRIGSKYEDTLSVLTQKINTVYRISILTSTGGGGDAYIELYDDLRGRGTFLAGGSLIGAFQSGQVDTFFLPESNPGGYVASAKLRLVIPGSRSWHIVGIDVTDLRHNWNSQLVANQMIPFNTEVTIPPP